MNFNWITCGDLAIFRSLSSLTNFKKFFLTLKAAQDASGLHVWPASRTLTCLDYNPHVYVTKQLGFRWFFCYHVLLNAAPNKLDVFRLRWLIMVDILSFLVSLEYFLYRYSNQIDLTSQICSIFRGLIFFICDVILTLDGWNYDLWLTVSQMSKWHPKGILNFFHLTPKCL